MLIIWIIAIFFLASLIRSTFGFGDALISMPLLSFLLPVSEAAPLQAIFSTLIASYIIYKHFREVKWRAVLSLTVFTILATPLGILFVTQGGETLIKLSLAAVLIAFSLQNLVQPELLRLKNDRHAWAFGAVAGFLGGAYNTNGPPVIIYGIMRRWEPQEFRAILQGIFFPANIFILISHIAVGNWRPHLGEYALYAAPGVIIATLAGEYISRRFSPDRFRKSVFILLLIISLTLIVNVLFLAK